MLRSRCRDSLNKQRAVFFIPIQTGAEVLRDMSSRLYPAAASPLNRVLYLDWQQTLADNDLRKVFIRISSNVPWNGIVTGMLPTTVS